MVACHQLSLLMLDHSVKDMQLNLLRLKKWDSLMKTLSYHSYNSLKEMFKLLLKDFSQV